MNSGIYQILNIKTGKSYIGSAKNFDIRWRRHLKDLENDNHSSIKLQRSYKKHGKNSFIFKIIELVPYDKSKIVEREDFYIKSYNSKANGYNIADASFGDTWTACPNKEEKSEKLRIAAIKYYSTLTPEERKAKHGSERAIKGKTYHEVYGKEKAELLGEQARQRNLDRNMKGEGNPYFGKTHSKETRKLISDSQRGTKKPRVKVVIDGIFYESTSEAIRQTGITRKMIEKRIKLGIYSTEVE